jgi:hypothetical protein
MDENKFLEAIRYILKAYYGRYVGYLEANITIAHAVVLSQITQHISAQQPDFFSADRTGSKETSIVVQDHSQLIDASKRKTLERFMSEMELVYNTASFDSFLTDLTHLSIIAKPNKFLKAKSISISDALDSQMNEKNKPGD